LNSNSVDKAFLKVQKRIDNYLNQLGPELDNFQNEDIYIPDWEDLNKKKELVVSYRKVVQEADKINKHLSKIGVLIVALKEVKEKISESSSGYSISKAKSLRKDLDKRISKMYKYQDVLSNHKDSYENALRFYNSVQYILGSPKFYGMETS